MSATRTPPLPVTLTPGALTSPPAKKTISKTNANTTANGVSVAAGILNAFPVEFLQAGLRRFSVPEYHAMLDHGILQDGERTELLFGYVVKKMSKKRPHVIALDLLRKAIDALLTSALSTQCQEPVSAQGSEPEPDLAIIRGQPMDYSQVHPGPGDVRLIVEVSDTTSAMDRGIKRQLYAVSGFPIYWILNITDRQIEVYTEPQPFGELATYATRTDYSEGDNVPLLLDGQTFRIAVSDVLPAASVEA